MLRATVVKSPRSVHREAGGSEAFGLIDIAQFGNHWLDIAVQKARQIRAVHADAMIRDTVLREVVGADLLRAVTAADLRLALLREFLLLLLQLDVVEPRA